MNENKPKRKVLTSQERATIRKLLQAEPRQMSLRQIADLIGCSHTLVWLIDKERLRSNAAAKNNRSPK